MASQEKGHDGHEAGKEESLSTILTITQRTELTILLATATAIMREGIENNFDASAIIGHGLTEVLSPDDRGKNNVNEATGKDLVTKDPNAKNLNVDDKSTDAEQIEHEKKLLALREKELSAPKMKELKNAALQFFDAWREAMIKRVGEVVNSQAKTKVQAEESVSKAAKAPPTPDTVLKAEPPGSEAEDETTALHKLYPPIPTRLLSLSENDRTLVLHSMLLILLSLEHYSAPSRILLLYLTSSLKLSLSTLRTSEESTAHSLLTATKKLSGTAETKEKAHENAHSRAWKVGLASVAGAAVIGITGGLAAPLVAAGIGTVMGGLGLGATAAAGYLGVMAESSILVGSLFGAYGGRMGGEMMDKYAKEVQDFAFLPVRGKAKRHFLHHPKTPAGEAEAGKEDQDARRLRVAIGISGWLTEKEEVITPWRVIGHGAETFALRFELEALLTLGNSMVGLVNTAAWSLAKKEIIKRTIFADLMLATWPLSLLKIRKVVDNPFSVAKARADKAGEVLADAIINRAQGERPVTLVGYSLGARVIYTALLSLARRRAFGLVESAVLMGTPAPSTSADWRAMRAVVAGRLVNVYSANDLILGFLYRTSTIQYGVAGLQKVEGLPGVENVDASGVVSGHLRYRFLVGTLLQGIGFEDVVLEEVEKEEEALLAVAEEAEELKQGGGEEESAEGLQAKAKEKTEKSMLARTMETLHIGGGGDVGAGKGDEKEAGEAKVGVTDEAKGAHKSHLTLAKEGLHLS